MVDVGGSVLTLRQEGKEFGQCSSTLGVINTRETSRTRRVMWSRSTDGPPGLRMKSGTTGSVSSRSDHSAASSHSTPPPATMVHYHYVGEHELLLYFGKWDVFSDPINRKKISRIRFWTRIEETGLSVCSCSASRSGRSSDRTCENVYL